MSSARILLVTIAAGLAACAHTPNAGGIALPDISRTAPVLIESAANVPPGYDEHVVVTIDRARIEQAYRAAGFDPLGRPLYYDPGYAYRRPVSRPSTGGSGTTMSGTGSAGMPSAGTRTFSGSRGAPGRSGPANRGSNSIR